MMKSPIPNSVGPTCLMSFLLLYVQTDKQQVGYAEFLSACQQKEYERRGRFRPKKKKIDDGDQLVRVSAYLQ